MRTIGLIGGMSWHSTAEYYRIIQETTAARHGGHSSAPLILWSVDFAEVRRYQLADDWAAAGDLLAGGSRRLEEAGADLIVLATNLMHKVAPAIEAAVDVPFLHIADTVAAAAGEARTLGLLATRWVMEEPFYAERLARHGLATLTPEAEDRAAIDAVIFDELTQGRVTDHARRVLRKAADDLAQRGADAVVLACTELELALTSADSEVSLIDSTRVHSEAAVDAALVTR